MTAPAAPSTMQGSGTTLYEALGVGPNVPQADIRRAYLQAARACHPDRQSLQQRPQSPTVDDDGAGASFLLIKEAWDTLSDPAKRAAYDKCLAERAGEDGGFVSEELQVEEMERDEGLPGWTYPCRCGEAFHVLEEELPEGAAIVVTCDGCSLRARVGRAGERAGAPPAVPR